MSASKDKLNSYSSATLEAVDGYGIFAGSRLLLVCRSAPEIVGGALDDVQCERGAFIAVIQNILWSLTSLAVTGYLSF